MIAEFVVLNRDFRKILQNCIRSVFQNNINNICMYKYIKKGLPNFVVHFLQVLYVEIPTLFAWVNALLFK